MFVIESCQKIEYNALFMMIFIPVSNFGDQPLEGQGIRTFISYFNSMIDIHKVKWSDYNKWPRIILKAHTRD